MNRRSWLGTALVALLAVVAGVLVLATDALHSTELRTVDARFSVRGPQAPPKDVIVVGLDKRTIEAGEDGKYPIDRARHAAVIDALKHAGAKVIAYDIEFSTPGPDKKSDAALAKSIASTPNLVLATTGPTLYFSPEKAANGNLKADSDGRVRQMPGAGSFSLAAADEYLGHPVRGPSGALIDFPGGSGSVRQISFADG